MAIVIPTNAYPLTWPVGVKRTTARRQSPFFKRSGFERHYRSNGDGLTLIRRQLELMHAKNVVISSNLQLRSDGFPYADGPQRPGGDVGVAVYWATRTYRPDGSAGPLVPHCMPCDRRERIGCNLYAIGTAIEALRGMERWGCVTVEQAFAGFAALPAGDPTVASSPAPRPWREVLGDSWPELAPDELLALAKTRHRKLIAIAHTDRAGGDHERAVELNAAIEAAERELS